MKVNRRNFVKTIAFGTAFVGLKSLSAKVSTSEKSKLVNIAILHTNDTHSRIEPFADNDPKYPGMGGFAQRASMIKQIRKQTENVIVLDAGDVFQGTPYFNMFNGELEFKLMSEMGYDAANVGNHEFDSGLNNFLKQIENAKFPIVNSNYDFSNTILKDKVKPYIIIEKQEIKIGIFGVGVKLEGLVSKENYAGTVFINPYEKAAEMAHLLKKDKKCDIIICLSHLGLTSDSNEFCDVELAKQSKNIDIIIGGHSHTFLDKHKIIKNSDNKEVIIGQVGFAGVKLGRIDLQASKQRGITWASSHTINIFKNQV